VADAILTIPVADDDRAEAGAVAERSAAACRPFVAGPENRLLAHAIEAILELPGVDYNPLVLYGRSGTGKTHLAHTLCAQWKASDVRRKPVYCPAADFVHQWREAVQTQALVEFRRGMRRTSLLVLDDLHHLADKEAAQRELAETLDTVIGGGRQVIVTCNAPPGGLKGFTPHLRSRLSAGLTVALSSPGVEARAAILEQLAAGRGLRLQEEASRLLAEALEATAARLQGVLAELESNEADRHGVIDSAAVRRYLGRMVRGERPTIHRIALATSRVLSVPLAELRGRSRRRGVAAARHTAMFLAYELTGKSFHQIGAYFGGRDHTTVMHGCRQTQRRLESQPETRNALEMIKQKLAG
jgi:chromosomal replication initiator protein